MTPLPCMSDGTADTQKQSISPRPYLKRLQFFSPHMSVFLMFSRGTCQCVPVHVGERNPPESLQMPASKASRNCSARTTPISATTVLRGRLPRGTSPLPECAAHIADQPLVSVNCDCLSFPRSGGPGCWRLERKSLNLFGQQE
jgi:hypothetical protein